MLCKKTYGEAPPPPVEYVITLSECEKESLMNILWNVPDCEVLGDHVMKNIKLNAWQCRFLERIKALIIAEDP